MSQPISTGNIRRYLHACDCGRTFELDAADQPVPAHKHNHVLDSGDGVHTCTGCLWAVFTFTDQVNPEGTRQEVARAFAKHLDPDAGVIG